MSLDMAGIDSASAGVNANIPPQHSSGSGGVRNGALKLHKVNGCLERTQERPVLVVQSESIAEDIEYYCNHVLICKFLGMRVSLAFLDNWIRKTWNPEGDFDILMAANNFFMVDFSCASDRNRAFEGGPYFYNQVGLFIKPWHAGFNSAKELPSRVPVWVRLPRLPLECWRSDILQSIALLLGRPIGPSQQTLNKRIFSYARVCVEIDLSKPLPDSIDMTVGSCSWTQPLDYEMLPFRC